MSERPILVIGLVLSAYSIGGAQRAMAGRICQELPACPFAFWELRFLRRWVERQEMSFSKNVVKGGATRFLAQVIENAAKINMQTMSLLPMQHAIM
jgi:hypothetical protein